MRSRWVAVSVVIACLALAAPLTALAAANGTTAAKATTITVSGLPWTGMGHMGGLNRLSLRGWSYGGLVQFGGNCVINCNNGGGNLYSFHPGGANVALADGKLTEADLDMLLLTDDIDEAIRIMVDAREGR